MTISLLRKSNSDTEEIKEVRKVVFNNEKITKLWKLPLMNL